MARYGRNYGGYDQGYQNRGYTGRSNAPGSRYGGEYRASGYDRGYGRGGYGRDSEGGWGMTNLFNTIMHGGPRGRARYGQEFYHRPSSTPYGSEYESRPYGTEFRPRRGQRSPDSGSVGVHYRGADRGRY
jgi:hypothetical protein